ncbi:MAG: NADH dehydrogenase [Lachnospiraceae bacterium]|nr:NADH dehydrogenase [Lachnospiraceae bacterium]
MSGNLLLLAAVLWPMAAAFISYFIGRFRKTARNRFTVGATVSEFLILLILMLTGDSSFSLPKICGMSLELQMDGFRALYGCIAGFMWMMTTLFSGEYFGHYRNRNRYYLFLLMTLGATVGVFLSADLFTTFIFFEIMSFTSYVWVLHDEKPAALRAAETYLAVAVIGGMVMLMGLFLLYNAAGTLRMEELLSATRTAWETDRKTLYLAGALMVFGFGAKAGMFPLHIWLPKAHPVAPAPASALLSGILTKSGIFGILAVTCNIFLHDPTWGMAILLLGTVTMFGGALLAVFSIDFKRTLACSSMSQIGFILVGVGMQCLLGELNSLAVRGTVLHMVNHSLIKLDLFMVAGVIYMNLHQLDLNRIRGFGRKKPLLMACFLMGALGIGGIPLWNGYISKTLLHESIVEYAELFENLAEAEEMGIRLMGSYGLMKGIEWVFLISGGMTVAYMLKLFICVFLESNSDEEVQKKYDNKKEYWNIFSRIAICGSAAVLPVMGMLPGLTMNKMADMAQSFMHLEHAHEVHYFTWTNLKGGLISIGIGVALYFGVIRTLLMKKTAANKDGKVLREYVDRWPAWLDLENGVYRPLIQVWIPRILGAVCGFLDKYIIHIPLKVFMSVTGSVAAVLDKYIIELPMKVFNSVTAAAVRGMDQMADGIILLARKTTHRQILTMEKEDIRDEAAVKTGRFLDKVTRKTTHVASLVELEERVSRTDSIIRSGLSFGLLMAVLGLIVILLYILFV